MATAVENQPITVNLIDEAKTTGWSINGIIASHTSCNSGAIKLTGYTIVAGHQYQISYQVITISGGSVQMFVGDTAGVSRTTTGSYVETLTATGLNPILYFFSNANCSIRAFNIRDTFTDTSNTQKTTVVYSPAINKWTSFYTMAPDIGFSMYIRTLVFQYGIMYSQANGSNDRNNLFGTQYDSLFTYIDNKNAGIIKSYQALAIQSNQLIITTDDGIQTSLGQVSTLIDTDFLQQSLVDGNVQVDVYDRYGVYMASFLNDENDDVVDGNGLKGNYIIIRLKSTESDKPMQIFSVDVKSSHMKIGNR